MEEPSDRVMGGMFLGLLFFGFFLWMLSQVVARVFHDLGIMFHAIGGAAFSFLSMAAGAAVAYAAYRHYQLVKQATEVLDAVEARCMSLTGDLYASQKKMEERLNAEVLELRTALEAALTKPEAIPEPQKTLPAPAHTPATIEVAAISQPVTTPGVSNPY